MASFKLPGTQGQHELERALAMLGEKVSWSRLGEGGRQWQHRCDASSQYGNTVINWYEGKGTVVCQGGGASLLERHVEGALNGRAPVQPVRPQGTTSEFESFHGATALGRAASHRAHGEPKAAVKAGLAGLRMPGAAGRENVDKVLRSLGEIPAWVQVSDAQHQHRCRPLGRYDGTVVNWYTSNGRIVVQGLNSAALEVHLEKALRSGVDIPPPPSRMPPKALKQKESTLSMSSEDSTAASATATGASSDSEHTGPN